MTHENAPATKLIAVFCCACRLPLVDSDSVELGIGPVCRKKIAKEDIGQPADWEACADALARFSMHDQPDDERRVIFERCLDNLDTARTGIDPQKLANVITRYVAAVQHRHDPHVGDLVEALHHMGRPRLAARIRERLYTVRIVESGNEDLLVHAPYSETLRNLMWSGRIGRWDKAAKAYRVPVANRADLFRALKASYPGTNAHGPKGEFRI